MENFLKEQTERKGYQAPTVDTEDFINVDVLSDSGTIEDIYEKPFPGWGDSDI